MKDDKNLDVLSSSYHLFLFLQSIIKIRMCCWNCIDSIISVFFKFCVTEEKIGRNRKLKSVDKENVFR